MGQGGLHTLDTVMNNTQTRPGLTDATLSLASASESPFMPNTPK